MYKISKFDLMEISNFLKLTLGFIVSLSCEINSFFKYFSRPALAIISALSEQNTSGASKSSHPFFWQSVSSLLRKFKFALAPLSMPKCLNFIKSNFILYPFFQFSYQKSSRMKLKKQRSFYAKWAGKHKIHYQICSKYRCAKAT